MKQFITSGFLVLLSAYTYGCNNNAINKNNGADTTKFPPVETKAANTNYKPAFKGQTRVSSAKTTTAYQVDMIAEKLGRPWAVIPMPDGRLLITEKTGFMQILNANGSLAKKITGLADKAECSMLH